LNQLVTELAHAEKALKEKHSSKMQEIVDKFETKKSHGFKPSIELSNIKRKVVGLIKMRSYELAGV
jgi:polyhydroxyalkanoate synthesis regulator phasin